MKRGRPPDGVSHVDRLEGPEELKRRLRLLLETIVGSVSVPQACAELGLSESRLHELRREALVGALGALMPRPSGRPAAAPVTTSREDELQSRVKELEVELQAAYVRTELALAMPHLFKRSSKKKPGKPRPSGHGAGDAT